MDSTSLGCSISSFGSVDDARILADHSTPCDRTVRGPGGRNGSSLPLWEIIRVTGYVLLFQGASGQ
jgi:hypothetical protein